MTIIRLHNNFISNTTFYEKDRWNKNDYEI